MTLQCDGVKQYRSINMYYELKINGKDYYVVDGFIYTIDTIVNIFNYVEV